jgi:hypothetical protein
MPADQGVLSVMGQNSWLKMPAKRALGFTCRLVIARPTATPIFDTVSFECGFAKNTLSQKVGPTLLPMAFPF